MLNAVIRHVLSSDEFRCDVRRGDDSNDPSMIIDSLIKDILSADLVVADLSGLNPNVIYELGIRHVSRKPAILVAATGTVNPFNIFGFRTIYVDTTDWNSIVEARARLADAARAAFTDGYENSAAFSLALQRFESSLPPEPAAGRIAGFVGRFIGARPSQKP